jgi:ADP-heptose:LPS heptosyltransferase
MTVPALLVIAGADLIDLVHALPALAGIRAYHAGAQITLLCAPGLGAFAREMPYVDAVWTDTPPRWWERDAVRRWRARLQEPGFARVYDLDGGTIGGAVFRLRHGRVAPRDVQALSWNGPEPGPSIAPATPAPPGIHVRDRIALQLKAAGIAHLPPADLTWVARRMMKFTVPLRMTEPFGLICADPAAAGASLPLEMIIGTATEMVADSLVPVLVGTEPTQMLAAALAEQCPRAVDLTGRVPVQDLVFLAWAARAAVGCDTGLMHVFAAAGCNAVVLCDATSDPARTGPRGARVTVLRRPQLAEIGVAEVARAAGLKR